MPNKQKIMNTLIAIDPGKGGGAAIFYDWKLGETTAFSGETDMLALIVDAAIRTRSEGGEIRAVMEQVGGFVAGGEHRQPGSAMFNFGANYGFYRGVFAALQIPLELVRPQEWQKGVAGVARLKGTARKRALKEAAARLFPTAKPTLATADAILIGDWHLRRGSCTKKSYK